MLPAPAPRKHYTLIRVMLYTLLAVALTFCAEMLFFMNTLYDSDIASAKSMILGYTERIATSMRDILSGVAHQMRYVREMLEGIDAKSPASLERANRALRDIFKISPDAYCTWYVLTDGEHLDSVVAKKAYVEEADGTISEFSDTGFLAHPASEPWCNRPFSTGGRYVGTVRFAPKHPGEDAIYTAVVSAPLLDASGKIIGVCGMNIVYKHVIDVIYKFLKEKESRGFLLGSDMTIFYAPPIKEAELIHDPRDRKLGDFPFVDKAKKRSLYDEMTEELRRNGVFWREMTGPFVGVPAFVSIHRIDFDIGDDVKVEPLYMFMGTKLGTLYASANRNLFIILLIAVIFLCIIAGVIYFNVNAIAKPIKKLSDDALRISEGDYDVTFEAVAGSDKSEIGTLTRSLSTMLWMLKNSLREVEERVEERTYELAEMTR
jgi:hypothetical protein